MSHMNQQHGHAHLPSGICGDKFLGVGEECDDGNTAGGDGCSSICKNEGFGCSPMASFFSQLPHCCAMSLTDDTLNDNNEADDRHGGGVGAFTLSSMCWLSSDGILA